MWSDWPCRQSQSPLIFKSLSRMFQTSSSMLYGEKYTEYLSVFAPLNLKVENISLYVYQVSVVQRKTKKTNREELYEDFGPFWTRRRGKTSVHTNVYGVMHCTTENKRGGCSCFEEAQDSYGLEANHKETIHMLWERETDKHVKCKRPTRAGRIWQDFYDSSKESETTLFSSKKLRGKAEFIDITEIKPDNLEASNRDDEQTLKPSRSNFSFRLQQSDVHLWEGHL